jgi:hypothetical protein
MLSAKLVALRTIKSMSVLKNKILVLSYYENATDWEIASALRMERWEVTEIRRSAYNQIASAVGGER